MPKSRLLTIISIVIMLLITLPSPAIATELPSTSSVSDEPINADLESFMKKAQEHIPATLFKYPYLGTFINGQNTDGAGIFDSLQSARNGTEIIVDGNPDGNGYFTISEAVRNADDGDRVVVQQGTYYGGFVIDKNLTLIAPDGATIQGDYDGDGGAEAGITVEHSTRIRISGFTFKTQFEAIEGRDASGEIYINDTKIIGTTDDDELEKGSQGAWCGICASISGGDWVIQNTTVENTTQAIRIEDTTGDITINNVVIKNSGQDSFGGDSINAEGSSGSIRIENSTIIDGVGTMIKAIGSSSTWKIQNSSFYNTSSHVIRADGSEGQWVLENTEFYNTSSHAIQADGSEGQWVLEDTEFLKIGFNAINNDDSKSNWILSNNKFIDTDGFSSYDSIGDYNVKNNTFENSGGFSFRNSNVSFVIKNSHFSTGDLVSDLSFQRGTSGEVVIKNTTHLSGNVGVSLDSSNITLTLENSTFTDYRRGIRDTDGKGNYTLADIDMNHTKVGIDADGSKGDWMMSDVNLHIGDIGIDADRTTGNWLVNGLSINKFNQTGISALKSSGDFQIYNSTIQNITDSDNQFRWIGVGIYAFNVSGSWKINNSSFLSINKTGIDAGESVYTLQTDHNVWINIEDSNCTGNIKCNSSPESPADNLPTPHPVISILDEEPIIGPTVNISGQESSYIGEIMSYEWDINSDGKFERNGETILYTFDSPGEYSISLRVNSEGGNETTTKIIEIYWLPQPEISIRNSSTNDDSALIDNSVTLSAHGSSQKGGDIVSYEWDLNGDGSFEKTGVSINTSFSTPNNTTIRLRVTSENGISNIVSKNIQVIRPLQVEINPKTEYPVIGIPISLDVNVTGGEHYDDLNFEWDLDNDGEYEYTGKIVNYNFSTAGNVSVSLRVIDQQRDENIKIVEKTIQLYPTPQPVILIKTSDPKVGELITFSASNSSVSYGSISGYRWDMNNDGDFEKQGEVVQFTFNNSGKQTVNLELIDETGSVFEATKTITVTNTEETTTISDTERTTTVTNTDTTNIRNKTESIGPGATDSQRNGTITDGSTADAPGFGLIEGILAGLITIYFLFRRA